ncbi:histone deacetylase domain-containing protein [Aspergillus pseudoustus]|uniref:Histone deacetylase domain-containing protein n=1 Tax=Aspergillus pseudoustus TaxID=1810923 RepID=A0ABR4J8Y6_9EURO
MDPSNPFNAAATTKTPSRNHPQSPPPIDPSILSDRLSYPSLTATYPPPSPSAFSSSSHLSPSDPPARFGVNQPPHLTPRRIPSSSSLRDERRKSTPNLKKRSSTASLRSDQLNSGGSASPRPSLSRRSSSTLATSPTAGLSASGYTMAKRPSLSAAAEQPIQTAASIAADHFKREIEHHQSVDLQSQTLVVIHDACYGHRFSRPRTSRAALSSIVERPERVRACVVGVSAAYVRLARRHAGGRFAPHPDLDLHQLPVPPFQIRKTARSLAVTSPAVTHVHGTKWMEDLKSMCDAAESRLALNGKELVRPRSSGKDSTTGASSDKPFHEGDLYLCSESLTAFEGALGGVCEGVDAIFSQTPAKRAFVCIRPPGHHCSANHPSGFCWINNVHVGISYAAMTHGLTHAAILDFDLHHGDGSQDITWEQNQKALAAPKNAPAHKKAMVGYFSLHDINSYPCEMGEPEKVRNASVCIEKAHGQSIWNVHLEPWKTEQDFWDLYATRYSVLIDRARAFLRMHTERLAAVSNGPSPKAAIFISAGFDASEWEGAGMQRHQVNVPTQFYAKFTADVVRMAEEEGLGVDGRIVSVLEGGYSNRALTTGVLSHLSGLGDTTQPPADEYHVDRLATEMTDRLGLSDIARDNNSQSIFEPLYDREWWSPPLLEELEDLVYPPPPAAKPREKSAPTYFAPTQSFSAKVVLPTRDRKSNGSHASLDLEPHPLPPVSWAVAAHELSKVLIPSDRQTASCRPEELNAEASRLRRERHTATADNVQRDGDATPAKSATGEEKKMKLRIRKPKPPLPSSPRAETPARRTNRNSRRTTLDSPSALPDPSRSPGPRTTRRKSAASTPEQNGADQRPSSRGSMSARKPNMSGTPKRTAIPSAFRPTMTSDEQQPASDSSRAQDDMDSLTANVENAAREKKAEEERRRKTTTKPASKPSRSPRKTSGKPSVPTATSATSQRSVVPRTSPEEPRLPIMPESPDPAKEEPLEGTERHPALSLATPDASSPMPVEPKDAKAEPLPERHEWNQDPILGASNILPSHGPYTGISPPLTPGPVSPQSMLYSPLTTSSVSRTGLPVFTSRGPIPFASSVPRDEVTQAKPKSESEV